MSIADELEKLANLRDNGALTEEEFQEHKKRSMCKILPTTNMKNDLNSKKMNNSSANSNTSSTTDNKDFIIGILFIFVCIYGVWKIGIYSYDKFFSSPVEITTEKSEQKTETESNTLTGSSDSNEKIGFELIKRPEGAGLSAFCDRFENIHIIEHINKTAGALNYPVHIIGYSFDCLSRITGNTRDTVYIGWMKNTDNGGYECIYNGQNKSAVISKDWLECGGLN